MAVCDEDATNASTALALLYDGIEVVGIVNGWIDDDGALGSATQYDGVCAWPSHQ